MNAYAKKLGLVLAPLVLAVLTLVAFSLAAAANAESSVRADGPRLDEWVITANISDTTIHTVNTVNNTVYGPFLEGQLGAPQNLLDVAVTPDGNTALVSNFVSGTLYFIDISDPISPSLLGSVDLPLFAEDIAITHDGKFALVTDGGLNSLVASVGIISRTLVYTLDISPADAQAVDVAPNGTVILADYLGGGVETLLIDASGHLTYVETYTNTYGTELPWPVNVAVAPDGQTVVVGYAFTDAVGIYQVTGPGILTYTGVVTGLPGDQQSVAFNAAGDRAFVVSVAPTSSDQLSVLDITAPGKVNLNKAGAANLLSDASGSFFGVDVIAVAGGKAYIGNSSSFGVLTSNLSVVDLTDYGVISVPVGAFPVGVAAVPPRRLVMVGKAGAGSGTVTSDPSGINCGVTCTTDLNNGTLVTLTAMANMSSTFAGWSGACSGVGACALIMTETKQVTATFDNNGVFLPMVMRSP